MVFIRTAFSGWIVYIQNDRVTKIRHDNYRQRRDEALKIHLSLFPLFKKLFMAPNPVPVKEALSKMNLIENVLRRPLTKMNEAQLKEFYSVVEKYIVL